MILLVGGTSETAPLASGIARAGCAVLVSTATDVPLDTGDHPLITRRSGPLVESRMVALIRETEITGIVDAAHPYAGSVHETIGRVAKELGIPCFIFRRPAELDADQGDREGITVAENHAEAAVRAFAEGSPVLLTTGSRNLGPYAAEAHRTGIPLAVRVLDSPESLAACHDAGIPDGMIITGRGPFSVDENIAIIHQFDIGAIVTKESGRAGGFAEKLTAARMSGCRLVVIRRPAASAAGPVFDAISPLVAAVASHCNGTHPSVDLKRRL
jgi:precorrin-6A/cobalt-precorrin-6A reductase